MKLKPYPGLFVLKFSVIIIFFAALPTFGQSLLGVYEFPGDPIYNAQYHGVQTQPAYATFSEFSRQNVNYAPGIDYYNTKGWDPAFNTAKYIEFTISAKPGYSLTLTEISFKQYRTTEGPKSIQITHNGSGDFNTDFLTVTPASTLPAKDLIWNFPDFHTLEGGSVTFRIYGWEANKLTGAFRIDDVKLYGTMVPEVQINEFHYFNTAQTQNSFVELLVPKDYTHLSEVTLSLYNADGQVYFTETLAKFKAFTDAVTDRDKVYFLDMPVGMAEQGGIAVSTSGRVVEFLSYGGMLKAVDGPAAGLVSQDVGVIEASTDGTLNSVYLPVTSSSARQSVASSSSWTKYDDNRNTKGYPNDYLVTLPVDFVYFKASVTSQGVELKWETASEIDNQYFAIEKSLDAQQFHSIGQIKGNGTVSGSSAYTYLDKSINRTAYYRLKQVDIDGSFIYSAVISATRQFANLAFKAYPNPATELIQVEFPDNTNPAFILVMDLQGRLLLSQHLLPESNCSVNVSQLHSGIYILWIVQGKQKWSQQFTKQ